MLKTIVITLIAIATLAAYSLNTADAIKAKHNATAQTANEILGY